MISCESSKHESWKVLTTRLFSFGFQESTQKKTKIKLIGLCLCLFLYFKNIFLKKLIFILFFSLF
jgi:hypothetical protein